MKAVAGVSVASILSAICASVRVSAPWNIGLSLEYSVSKSALNFYGKFISKKFSKNQVRINILIRLLMNTKFWK